MTHEQKPESAEFRTRKEQLAFYPQTLSLGRYPSNSWQLRISEDEFDPYQLIEGPVMYVRCDIDHKRRKDAEGAEPIAWVPIHPKHGNLWTMTTNDPNQERLPRDYPLAPLYDRPANVAALEARVKELESYEKDAVRFKWLLENVGLYYGIPGFAAERGRTPENRVEALLNAIDANIERATAAIREGGEHG